MIMTPTERDNELRSLLGEMPYFVIDWLELSDDLRHEWKKGSKASDFGGQRAFIQKYEKKLADFITADRERVALEKEEMAFRYAIQTLQDTSKEFAIENLQRQLDKNLAQQEEV